MVISWKRTWTGSLNKALWELLLHVWARLSSVRRFPGDASGNNPPANAGNRDSRIPLGQEDPCSRKRQPALEFLPGKCHGQRSLADAVHGVTERRTWLGTRSWAVPWVAWPWVWLWAGGLDFSLCFQRNRSPTWQGHWGPWPEWSRAGEVQIEQTSCSFFLGNILAFDTTFLLVIINCFGWTFRYEVSNSPSVLTNYFCYLFVPLEQVFSTMMLLTFFFLSFFLFFNVHHFWSLTEFVTILFLFSVLVLFVWEIYESLAPQPAMEPTHLHWKVKSTAGPLGKSPTDILNTMMFVVWGPSCAL